MMSDVINFVVFTLIGYRKKVLMDNITQSFPEKSVAEHKTIISDFQRAFCDHWLETIKLLAISERKLKSRIEGNWELFEQVHESNKAIYALLGHRFNWEWGNVACQINTSSQFAGIYLPLNNKVVDRLMYKIRSRMGSMLIPANDMRPYMKTLSSEKHIIGFMADQTPSNLNVATWYQFLHQPAPFLTGPEKAAKLANAAVVYAGLYQVKRGFYKVKLELICNQARATKPGFITHQYVKHLQAEMELQPHNWLWTHRRWKRQPNKETMIAHV